MNASLHEEAIGLHQLYRELEAWFTDRNYDELAGLCSRLARWHSDAYLRSAGVEIPRTSKSAAVPRSARPREFLFRLASPAELLEVALGAETSEECAAKLRAAIKKVKPVNWETALASGISPGLALGADRRLRRS